MKNDDDNEDEDVKMRPYVIENPYFPHQTGTKLYFSDDDMRALVQQFKNYIAGENGKTDSAVGTNTESIDDAHDNMGHSQIIKTKDKKQMLDPEVAPIQTHVDDEGNVVPDPTTPINPGVKLKYTVSNPENGTIDEYWFTDADIQAIGTQFQKYQHKIKEELYPK